MDKLNQCLSVRQWFLKAWIDQWRTSALCSRCFVKRSDRHVSIGTPLMSLQAGGASHFLAQIQELRQMRALLAEMEVFRSVQVVILPFFNCIGASTQ